MLLKRVLDVVLALLAITALSPVLLIVALAVRIIDGAPVFYVAARVGRNGVAFDLIKFRSMRSAAEVEAGRITLGSADTRITPLGAFLRGKKIDELPQLFNVIKGDMSIVGPRPEDPRVAELYSKADREVLRFRPGMTDVTVTRGHLHDAALLDRVPENDRERFYREVLMRRKLDLNIKYIRDWEISADLAIIAKTVLLLTGIIKNEIPEEMYASVKESGPAN